MCSQLMEEYKRQTDLEPTGLEWEIYLEELMEIIGGNVIPLLVVNIIIPFLIAFPLLKIIGAAGLAIQDYNEEEEEEEEKEMEKVTVDAKSKDKDVKVKL